MTINHSELNYSEETEISGEAGKEKEQDYMGRWSAWEQGISGTVGLTNLTTYE